MKVIINEVQVFQRNEGADPCGTSLRGEFPATYQQLAEAFGEAAESDGYKVSGEWIFTDLNGNVYTLYDWKQTELYDDSLQSVRQFRKSNEIVNFHIGAHPSIHIGDFQEWLALEVKESNG